jgi:hypothetical protein
VVNGCPAIPQVAALHFFDHDPRDAMHVLAFDKDHRVRQPPDDFLLLIAGEDTLDKLDIDSGMCSSFLYGG